MSEHWADEADEWGKEGQLYECSCGTEGLTVQSIDWDQWREIWIALWIMGHGGRWCGLRQRIRHIYRVIRYGHPYVDMVSLECETARKLGQRLIELADKLESSE